MFCCNRIIGCHTVCPRSSDPFYIVSYYIKWVTTSWTYSISLVDFYPRKHMIEISAIVGQTKSVWILGLSIEREKKLHLAKMIGYMDGIVYFLWRLSGRYSHSSSKHNPEIDQNFYIDLLHLHRRINEYVYSMFCSFLSRPAFPSAIFILPHRGEGPDPNRKRSNRFWTGSDHQDKPNPDPTYTIQF